MSMMTAVNKYVKVMGVVARMTESIYTTLPSSGPGVAWAAILQTVLLNQLRSLNFFTYLFSVNIPSLISRALTRWMRLQFGRQQTWLQVELVRKILPRGAPLMDTVGGCSGPSRFDWHFNHSNRSPLSFKSPQTFHYKLGTNCVFCWMLL